MSEKKRPSVEETWDQWKDYFVEPDGFEYVYFWLLNTISIFIPFSMYNSLFRETF